MMRCALPFQTLCPCISWAIPLCLLMCLNSDAVSASHAIEPPRLEPALGFAPPEKYYAAAGAQEADEGLSIIDITFKAAPGQEEIVYFHSDRYFWPCVRFALEEEESRLVVEVDNVTGYGKGEAAIPVGGDHVKLIRPRYSRETKVLTVVLDLHEAGKHSITQGFNRAGNIYALRIGKRDEATAPGTKEAPEPALPPTEADIDEITSLIESWRAAWEGKRTGEYMGHYHPGFESKGRDLAAWKKLNEDRNARHKSRTVTLSDLGIDIEGQNARAYFGQSFRADSYHDEGYKIIELRKDKNAWKIFREQWFAEKPPFWP